LTIRPRELAWEGCLNVRDLGGLPTEDGGETRYGRVVRADSVRQLTDAGWQAVADYGVRTVVDLRGDYELRDDPPGELPFEVVHVPFMEATRRSGIQSWTRSRPRRPPRLTRWRRPATSI
jgi:hypothetical protein